jgi:hypothetical protein
LYERWFGFADQFRDGTTGNLVVDTVGYLAQRRMVNL